MAESTRIRLLRQLNVVDPDLPPNDLAVRFANTGEPRDESRSKHSRADIGVVTRPFADFADLVGWIAAMGGLDADESAEVRRLAAADPAAAKQEFEELVALRPVFHGMCVALEAGRRPDTAVYDVLYREASTFPTTLEFVAQKDVGGWTIPRGEVTLRRPRRQLVFSALYLLSTGMRRRVRLCPGKKCGLFFVAQPTETNRVWCHLGVCGCRRKYERRKRR